MLPASSEAIVKQRTLNRNVDAAFSQEYLFMLGQEEQMLFMRIRREQQAESMVVRGWRTYVKEAQALIVDGAKLWFNRELAVGFRTWRQRLTEAQHDVAWIEEMFERAGDHMPRAKLFNAFLDWVKFIYLRTRALHEQDRRAIETALAVQELEFVWGSQLSTYPEPDSCAVCDECGRVNCYRYYHVTAEQEGGTSVDLCESCYVGGELARRMAPDVRDSFVLVAPLIQAQEAWRDVADREREVAQMAYAAQLADRTHKRSNAEFAVRLLESAAAASPVPLRDRNMVTAEFPNHQSVRVSVPSDSRAAMLGERNPSMLGKAVIRIIEENKAAPSLSILQAVVQEQLMVSTTTTRGPLDLEDVDDEDDDLGGGARVTSSSVAAAMRTDRAERPTARALQMSGARLSRAPPMQGSAGQQAALRALTASVISTKRLGGGSSMQQLLMRTPANPADIVGQQSAEANFLLKQVSTIVSAVELSRRVQRKVQFGPNKEAMPLSVPADGPAADMPPNELGDALLGAIRRAPNVNQARATLNALLLPNIDSM